MSKTYDLSALAIAESNLAKATRKIDSMKKPRSIPIQELFAPLSGISDLVASSLGGVLPEECIFEDAPYPAVLLCDEVGEIKGYIRKAEQSFGMIGQVISKKPAEIDGELQGYLEELGKALHLLNNTLNS